MGTMKTSLRTFIAVDIAAGLRDEVRKLLEPARNANRQLRWVDDSQFHVTLKFLGDVPLTESHTVIRATQRACLKVPAFDLVFQGLGAFPSLEAPRSFWVGMTEGVEEMRTLAEQIEAELVPLGFPREQRTFMPHMTLCRSKFERRSEKEDDRATASMLELFEREKDHYFGCYAVDEVVVYSSELSRSGPRYEPLATIALPAM